MDLIPNKKSIFDSKPSASGGGLLGGFGRRRGEGEILAFRSLEALGNTLIRLSLGFLTICVLIFGTLYFFKYRTERQISEATISFSASAEALRQDKFVNYKNYVRQVGALEETSAKRIFASSVFSALESNTAAGVVWTGATLNAAANLLSLTGAANNYSTIAKQAVALRQTGFSKVELKDLKMSKDGGVTFSVSFIFSESLKKKSGD